jgi:hypothetical protein
MKMAATRLARWAGAASALTVREAPRNPVPTPAPPIAVPIRKAAADAVWIAASVVTAQAGI